MDTVVGAIGDVVVAAFEDADYMQSTIGQFRKSIRWLGVLAKKQDGVYTSKLGAETASMTTSPRTGRYSAQRHTDYDRLVWLFDSYVLTGTVDLSTRPRGQQKQGPSSPEFSELLAAWSHDMDQRGLARSTQNCFGGLAWEYLNYLEASEISSWEAADGASVLGFLESLRTRWAESSMWSAVASFRSLLKFTNRTDLLDALALARPGATMKSFHCSRPEWNGKSFTPARKAWFRHGTRRLPCSRWPPVYVLAISATCG